MASSLEVVMFAAIAVSVTDSALEMTELVGLSELAGPCAAAVAVADVHRGMLDWLLAGRNRSSISARWIARRRV